MPRDAKGQVFGHGSTMRVIATGKTFVVAGFATIVQGRINIPKLAAAIGKKYQYYRWVDVANVDPAEVTPAALNAVDHCAVDRATAAGSLAAANDGGDKVIWGT